MFTAQSKQTMTDGHDKAEFRLNSTITLNLQEIITTQCLW